MCLFSFVCFYIRNLQLKWTNILVFLWSVLPLLKSSVVSPLPARASYIQETRSGQDTGAGCRRCWTGTGSSSLPPPTCYCTSLNNFYWFQLLSRDTGIRSCNCTSWLMWPEGRAGSLAAAALHLRSLGWGQEQQSVSVAVSAACKARSSDRTASTVLGLDTLLRISRWLRGQGMQLLILQQVSHAICSQLRSLFALATNP